MEQEPKKLKLNSQPNHREYLADDLKKIRKYGDNDLAQKILEEERQTTRYKMAESVHSDFRKATQSEFIARKEEENNEIEFKKTNLTSKEKEEISESLNSFIVSNKIFDANVPLHSEFMNQQELQDFLMALRDESSLKNQLIEGNIKYPVNIDSVLLDYESVEPKIFRPEEADERFRSRPSLIGRGYGKSAKGDYLEYMYEKFGRTRYIPGVEYAKYLNENPDKVPDILKDNQYYYFPCPFMSAIKSPHVDDHVYSKEYFLKGEWVDNSKPSGGVYGHVGINNEMYKDRRGNLFYTKDKSPVGEPKPSKFVLSIVTSRSSMPEIDATTNFITLIPKSKQNPQ